MFLSLLIACSPQPGRVVVLGIDGLERQMVEGLAEKGDLPHFQQVMDEGSLNDLAVTTPVLSPIIWTTIASGYRGEVHGIGGWTSATGRPYTSADTRTLRVWDVASARGIPSMVTGWLMTWPVSPIPGAMLTDRFVWAFPMNKDPDDPTVELSREAHEDSYGLIWPADLEERATTWLPDDFDGTPIAYQLETYAGPFHPAHRDETHVRSFEAMWDETDARLGLIYLPGVDQVSHLYWPFTDDIVRRTLRGDPEARMRAAAVDRERHPGSRAHPWSDAPITPEQMAEGARWVPDYYRYVDGLLGRVMETIDPADTTLLVMSDHGFQTTQANPVLNGGHRPVAVLMAWGARVVPGAEVEASVLDIAPTLTALAGLPAAPDWEGRVLDDLVLMPEIVEGDTWILPRVAVDPSGAHDAASERLLLQLEALGYVDEMGAPVLGASRNLDHGDGH